MKVVVTGGNGYIGSSLLRALLQETESTITTLDSSTPRLKLQRPHGKQRHRIRQVNGDIADPQSVKRTFSRGVDVVIHLAALPNSARCSAQPELATKTNMIGTALILSESSRYNPLFIFASSQTVYGDATGHKASETMPPEPKDLYSLTKTAGECMAMSYHMAGLLRAVILRISSVYGTGAWANLEQIPGRMVTDCITNGAITLVSSTNIEEPGGQIVDLIHVRDVCDAIVKSINNKHRVAGEVLNISSGRGVSVRDVALSVARIAGERGIRDNVHYRSTHRPIRMIPRLVLANAKAKRLIGWRPRIRLEQGIEELFDYVEASRNDVLARGC